jgi:hypothetical protein
MKINLTIVSLLILQTFTIMASAKTEQQKYRVVHTEKEFEIRFYPTATLATIYSKADSYRELSGPGFRKLAAYIFGGNEGDTKISMTSPVHMDINDKESTMSFVMPSSYDLDKLPRPDNEEVVLETSNEEYVAALRFRGYASDKAIKRQTEKLEGLLREQGLKYYGNFRYLGYNPPYQFLGRRNEIIVSVKWAKEKQD